jgi:hypothetical protein
LTAARATAPAKITTQLAPMIIGPQTTGWISMYWVTATTNTPSFEYSLSYQEF